MSDSKSARGGAHSIIRAYCSGDAGRVGEILTRGDRVAAHEHASGTIALHRAAETGQWAPMRAKRTVIEERIGFVRQHGQRLHLATTFTCAGTGLIAAVQMLLERGAKPELHSFWAIGKAPSTVTPPHRAAMRHTTLHTPLDCTPSGGHMEVARMLLKEGADCSLRDAQFHGSTAGFARLSGNSDFARLLA